MPETRYERLNTELPESQNIDSSKYLLLNPSHLETLTKRAFRDLNFLLRPSHLKQVSEILNDPEATPNDKYVADLMLKNSVISAKGILPLCQDTGTALVMGWKGNRILTPFSENKIISQSIKEIYQENSLRYSQLSAVTMFDETNTKSNLPAGIDIRSVEGDEYQFLFAAKGGGSANKTYLFQESRSLLSEDKLRNFLNEKTKAIGTAACPPYHLAVVIGGLSAEETLKYVKLASCRYLDNLPSKGTGAGEPFRDRKWEKIILELTRKNNIGAGFGGKYFALDVRCIRLPRHAASCPVGIGVSCSADRNILGKINKDGVFIEKLEENPGKYLPSEKRNYLSPVKIDLNQGTAKTLKELSGHPVMSCLELTGTLIVARDIAHAKICENFQNGIPLPSYMKEHPVYYAGPAKKPEGYTSGSFGPTTAQRMDPYMEILMSEGASLITLAKGNRSPQVPQLCKKYGGFYLGSIGGPAAYLAKNCINKIEVIDFPELGVEAVHKIEVTSFPAFIICDDKGNNFFKDLT